MVNIYLVRHGLTEWNRQKRMQGQKNIPLAEEGKKQAEKAALFWKEKELESIYTSDLERAQETAKIIAEKKSLGVKTCPGLREINMGHWQGYTWDEVGVYFPEEKKAWLENPLKNAPKGGENLTEASNRFYNTLLDIAEKKPQGTSILVVAHGLVIGTAVCRAKGESPEFWKKYSPENTSVKALVYQKGTLKMK